jgi:hypothetical protein
MTVAANVPLGSLPEGITIGPTVYVVDLLLVILVAITLPTWRREHFNLAHGLLALYLVWSFLLVVVAPGPRPDVMFWYAIHFARFALVFAVVTRGIVDDWVTARGALGVVVLTAVGHALVASVQVITGPIGGLSVLGMNPRIVAEFSLGPLGSLPSGPYVGGFTGGSPFAVILTITIPIVLAAIFYDRVPRLVALGTCVWLVLILQLTAWDSARGALIVSLILFVPLFGWWKTGVLWERANRVRTAVHRSLLASHWRLVVGSVLAVATAWQLLRFRQNPTHQPFYLNSELGQGLAHSVTIPGFNTQNLSIRIYQYVGGLDTFLQYPLTGLGGANYNYIALNYGPRSNMLHNLYIAILSETGLVGALLFFGAMGYAIVSIWLAGAHDNDPLFLGLLIGIIGMLALQFFQPQYLRVTSFVPVWALLAIGCGRYQRFRSDDTLDRWACAWRESRIRVSTETSQLTCAVAFLPQMAYANFRTSQVISSLALFTSQLLSTTAGSTLVSTLESACGSSRLLNTMVRLRRYCRASKIFE